MIGDLSNKLAHLFLNLITVNQGRFTRSDLSDSFPDNSHNVGVRFIEPFTKCCALLRCQLFDCFLDFSQTHRQKDRFDSSANFLTILAVPQVPGRHDERIWISETYEA